MIDLKIDHLTNQPTNQSVNQLNVHVKNPVTAASMFQLLPSHLCLIRSMLPDLVPALRKIHFCRCHQPDSFAFPLLITGATPTNLLHRQLVTQSNPAYINPEL